MKVVHILGLDVSMNACGWAVLQLKNDVPIYVGSGVLKGNTKLTHGQRLRNQRQLFNRLLLTYQPTYIARESGFSRHLLSTQVLYKAYGHCDEFFAEYLLVEYTATTIKKVVGGYGQASKKEVERAVRFFLHLPSTTVFESDDETDAIAVALTFLFQHNLVRGDQHDDNSSHRCGARGKRQRNIR